VNYDITDLTADGAQEAYPRIAYFAPHLDDRQRHVDGCGLPWTDHDSSLPQNAQPFGCPDGWRERRIAELTDLLGDAGACDDGDCPCKANVSDYLDELGELSA